MSYLRKLHSRETGTMGAYKKETVNKNRLLRLRKASEKGINGKSQNLTAFIHYLFKNLARKMQLPAQDEIIEPDEEQNDQQMEQIAAEEPGPSGITNHNMQMAEIGTQTDGGYEFFEKCYF